MIICKLEKLDWSGRGRSNTTYTLSDDRRIKIEKQYSHFSPVNQNYTAILSEEEYAEVIRVLNNVLLDKLRHFLLFFVWILYKMRDGTGYSLTVYNSNGKVIHKITGRSYEYKTFENLIPVLCR